MSSDRAPVPPTTNGDAINFHVDRAITNIAALLA
jgi:hypothetical protein